MNPELRDRLIALLEAIVHPDQEERCPVCASTHCSHDDYSGAVEIQHSTDCELQACLQELRALQSMPYLELDENCD